MSYQKNAVHVTTKCMSSIFFDTTNIMIPI